MYFTLNDMKKKSLKSMVSLNYLERPGSGWVWYSMYDIGTVLLQEPDDAELSDEQETPHPDENPPGYQAHQSPQQGTSTKPEGGTTSQQPKQEGSTNQQFQNNHVNSTHNAQQVQTPIVPHDQIVNQLNNQNTSQTGENPDTGEEEKKKTNKE